MNDRPGYFTGRGIGDHRWGPSQLDHWPPPPNGNGHASGVQALRDQLDAFLDLLADVNARRRSPQTRGGTCGHLAALRARWEAEGIPWDPQVARGYLAQHPWERGARQWEERTYPATWRQA